MVEDNRYFRSWLAIWPFGMDYDRSFFGRGHMNVREDDGTIREAEADDYPCPVTWCVSNHGYCHKRFNGGTKPRGYGSTNCPGFIRVQPSHATRPTATGDFRAVKRPKRSRRKSIQKTL